MSRTAERAVIATALSLLAVVSSGCGRLRFEHYDRSRKSSDLGGTGLDLGGTSLNLSGTVFEDLQYGGGSGRNRATALAEGGSARPGARVELYDASGNFMASALTDDTGRYSFADLGAGAYTVRVVNNTVSSARGGFVSAAHLAVQTFRTSVVDGRWSEVVDHVGGEVPNRIDANAGTTTLASLETATTTAQSITAADGSGTFDEVDFGYSFSVIVNTNDAGPGSLRQFLTQANAMDDASLAISGRSAGLEHAVFMIPNGSDAPGLRGSINDFVDGVATLRPASALPTISSPLVLDAQTQPGWTQSPVVEIDGSNAGSGANGIRLTGGGSTLRGLVINRFSDIGILTSDAVAGGYTIEGNYVGVDARGNFARPNGQHGIYLSHGSNGSKVGGTTPAQRNVASGNLHSGIGVLNSNSVVITGNYTGLNAAGTAAVGNAWAGIGLWENAAGTTFNVRIGGTNATERNVTAGNDNGIYIGPVTSTGHLVQGNFIGCNAAGNADLPNSGSGIHIDGASVTVGGTTPASGNLIRGNFLNGITIRGFAGVSAGNAVLSNSIYGNVLGGIKLFGVSSVNNGNKSVAQPNFGMDSPLFTFGRLTGNTLSVNGYVGSAPGQSQFANSRVEIFLSDNDASGYGEGSKFLGFLITNASGAFSGSIDVSGSGLAIGNKITATATDSSNNTSEFGAQFTVAP